MRRALHLAPAVALVVVSVGAQSPPRKLGELELQLVGLSASLDPANPTVPKNVASGVRVVVKAGQSSLTAADVARFVGAGYRVEAELGGPGLRETITIPQRGPDDPPPADPLLLSLPPLNVAGDYTLRNVRLVAGSRSLLDVQPRLVPLKVIDQILVTSVRTRPLTLDEIRERGIVLDSDDYLGFEFSLGVQLESQVVNLSFPVVFDRQGAVVPPPIPVEVKDPTRQEATPDTQAVQQAASILPVLLTAVPDPEGGGSLAPLTFWEGQPIRIPSVLVIPGSVGYLKQFFSAQLFVANGAPAGAPLTVKNVTGTVKLPVGKDLVQGGADVPGSDDPLVLPNTVRGPQPATQSVRGVGPDGEPGTEDDALSFRPGEQGQAEFLIRGEQEGFHTLDFDIAAVLEGLPVGLVHIAGKATGGVLVRNPYFDVAFAVPSTVRRNEAFRVFMTVTNIGKGAANDLTVTLDPLGLAGARLTSDGTLHVSTLRPGEARVLGFDFRSDTTGAVVASYLGFDAQGGANVTGSLKFKLGVGERGVPLSPDTLALPASVELLPPGLVEAAMRLLGQAWSSAGAPAGSLPAGVTRPARAVVQQKALAFAEAGLRVTLGEPLAEAIRDLIPDFFGGAVDPGFDQLLRRTEAGRDFARTVGDELAAAVEAAGGAASYERSLASLLASGPDFVSFSVSGPAPVDVAVQDGRGRRLISNRGDALGISDVPAAVLLPLGPVATAPLLGLLAEPAASPYTITLSGGAFLSLTLPRGDGSFVRGSITSNGKARVVVDLARPDSLTLDEDLDGDGAYEAHRDLARESVRGSGPAPLSAAVIGPESFAGATPFGTHFAVLFDRPVDAATAAARSSYQVPKNAVLSARRQLSGRLVFGTLAYPEGPHVPTSITIGGVADARGVLGAAATLPLDSHLDQERAAGAVVIGRVVNADGSPVNGGTVYYANSPDNHCQAAAASAATLSELPLDDEGRYELRYVSRNGCGLPFEISYRDPRTTSLRTVTGVVRYDGERIVMDIVLTGRGAVAGVVRDLLGRPAPGAQVAVLSESDAHTGRNTQADGDGRYRVSDVAVGPVTVRAAQGLGLGFGAGRIARAGGTAVVDVTLDSSGGGRVTGRVYRLETGQLFPVAGELLSYRIQGSVSGYARTDADGRFVFEGMPAGAFTISGRSGSASGVPGQSEVNIVAEAPPETTLGEVRGRVLLPNGSPAPRVIVAKDVSSFIVEGGVVTDAEGRFRMEGLEVGRNLALGAITVDRSRTGSASFQIDPITRAAEGVVITLSGIGVAEFTVFDPAGAPLPGVEVTLVSLSGPLSLGACANPCGCRATTADRDGTVRFEGLPLGQVTAQALRRGAGYVDVARATVSLTRDGVTGVAALRFAGTGTVGGLVRYPPGVAGGGGEIALWSRVFRNDGRAICGLVNDVSHRAPVDPATGRFRFIGVNLGSVSVSATSPFFPTAVGGGSTLTSNGQALELELRFVDTTAGRLSGRVYLPDGLTPAGAGVEVTADGYSLQNVTVRTDAEGRYSFAALLPAGGYTLTARDPVTGNVVRGAVFLSARLDAQLDMRLKGRGSVRVRVVDGADAPIPNAFVRLSEGEFPNRTYEAAVEPANQGVAVFDRVFEGAFAVEASDHGRGGRVSSALPRVAGASVEVVVRLAVTGSARGHFRYADGSPVPFGLVRLRAGGRVLGQLTTPGAGDVGAFVFDFVPAGAVRVEAEDPLTTRTGFAVGTIVGEGQQLTLDVTAEGLGAVEGTVTSNGAAWTSGARIEVVSGTFRATTFSDGTGHYVLEGVPEGRVDVTASLSNGFLAGTGSGTLTGDGTRLLLDVALRDSGTVTGRVVQANGETGPPSLVWLGVGGTGGANQEAFTDSEGHFRFERVPVGRATLSVEALGSIDRARAAFEVPPGVTLDLTVPLNGIGTIRGHALGSSGLPVSGQVSISGGSDFPWSATIDVAGDGAFRVARALAGPITLALRSQQGAFTLYGTASGSVEPNATAEIDVQVEPSGTVRGMVVRADGRTPAIGAEVTLTLGQGRGSVLLQAGNNGHFEALGVPIGLFDLRALDPVTTGRAVVLGRAVRGDGDVEDLGTVALDESAPGLRFVEPQAGTTRARFGGPVVLELTNTSDLEPGSLSLTYPTGATLAGLTVSGARATGQLDIANLKVGTNVLIARAADSNGNLAEAQVQLTLTGGTVSGHVRRADGGDAAGVPVEILGVEALTADAGGHFSRSGLKPGPYTVKATDPATSLQASSSATLFDGDAEVAVIDVTLPAYGSIAGVVRHANGQPALGVRVQLGGIGPVVSTTASGGFRFDRLPLGTYTLNATDEATGDRGQTVAIVAAHGHETTAGIGLNGVGSARVRVRTATGAAVVGAQVVLTSAAGFSSTAPTDANGLAHFSNVLAGLLIARATDPVRGLTGEALGTLQDRGDTELLVTLPAAGRVEGRVLRADGSAGAGLAIALGGSKNAVTTTAADGAFGFDAVPVGSFELVARDANTGDGALGDGVVAFEAQTVSVELRMNGVGVVRATVLDASGSRVAGARVSASWGGRFFGSRAATTGASGVATLADVLAGEVSLAAYYEALGTRGSGSVTAPPGAAAEVSLVLEGLAEVRGHVLEPDGSTPAAGVVVGIGAGNPGRFSTTGADGAFGFENLRLVSYVLTADFNGRLRARVSPVAPTSHGQVIERDLVLVGVGTITGTLRDPSGSPVPGRAVSLTSQAPTFGGYRSASTGFDGRFSFADIPIGPFTLGASRGTERADASGAVVSHGDSVSVDLQLRANAVNLPAYLNDANGAGFRFDADGRFYSADFCGLYNGGQRLTLMQGGAPAVFTGSGNVVASEESGRELVFRQTGLHGLTVTRKAFVPRYGYFVRYLETLSNESAAPIVVDVVFETEAGWAWDLAVSATSSGDTILDASDRWVSYGTGRSGGCDFPPSALGFAGVGGRAPGVAALERNGNRSRLTTRWEALTVPPGTSVSLLHLWTQQSAPWRAVASAERLTSLPPELFEGLAPDEAAATINFALSTDLVSTVPGLPALDGEVAGRVLSGDRATPVANAVVVVQSRSPYYGRPLTVNAAQDGTFRISGDLAASVPRVLPRDAFDVSASFPALGVTHAASAEGQFAEGAQRATTDLVFDGTGAIEGRVLRSDGSVVLAPFVRVDGPTGAQIATSSIGSTAERFRFPVVSPGTYTLTATHPLGGAAVVDNAVSAVANQRTVRDLSFTEFGSLAGSVRTAAGVAVNSLMTLSGPNGLSRGTFATGTYAFPDLPPGLYAVTARDERNFASARQDVTVSPGAPTPLDLIHAPIGQVQATATVGGSPLASARALWRSQARGPDFVFGCTTDALGRCTLSNVSGPSVAVRVEFPGNSQSFGELVVPLTSEGQVVAVAVALPGLGRVTGSIRARNGELQPSPTASAVALYRGTDNVPIRGFVPTDGNGRYDFTNVPPGPMRIRVWRDNYFKGEVSGVLPAHGETLELDVVEPRGVLGAPGQRDLWQAVFERGQPIDIRLEGFAVGAAGALPDPYLELFGPDGSLIASNDDRQGGSKDSALSLAQAPVSGRYVVAASTRASSGGGYRLGSSRNDEAHVFRVYDGPTLSGRVSLEAQGAAVVGQRLRVLLPNGVSVETQTAAGGLYLVPLAGVGTLTVVALDAHGVAIGRVETSVVSPEQSASLDVSLPRRGNASVSVTRRRAAVPGVRVDFESDHATAVAEDRARSAATDVAGIATASLPVGNVTARVTDPETGLVLQVSGVLLDGATLSLGLSLPGPPLAALDVSGLPFEVAGVVDVPGWAFRCGGGIASYGLSIDGQPVDTAFTTGVTRADVRAAQQQDCPSLGLDTGFRLALDTSLLPDGWHSLVVRAVDDLGRTAVSNTRSISVRRLTRALLENPNAPLGEESIVLRGWAFVCGRLVTSHALLVDGHEVPEAALTPTGRRDVAEAHRGECPSLSDGIGFEFRVLANGFSAGQHSARVRFTDASGASYLTNQASFFVDPTVRAAGTLLVSYHRGAAAETRTLRIDAIETFVNSGLWSATVQTEGDRLDEQTLALVPGQPVAIRVPVGPYRVVFDQSWPPSAVEGVLAEGETQAVRLEYGSHELRENGPSGPFVLSLPPDWTEDPFGSFPEVFPRVVKLEQNGAAMRSLLVAGSGVRIRRQEYVPPSRAFRRTLTLVTNPGEQEVVLDFQTQLQLAGDGWRLGRSSVDDLEFDADDTFAVASWPLGTPTSGAIVIGGALRPLYAFFYSGYYGDGFAQPATFFAFHQLAIPPGETRAVLAFAVTANDEAAVGNRAASLAALSDPAVAEEALLGLTTEERRAVVNFTLPAPPASIGEIGAASPGLVPALLQGVAEPTGRARVRGVLATTGPPAANAVVITLRVGEAQP